MFIIVLRNVPLLSMLGENLCHNVQYFFRTSSLDRHFMYLCILILSMQTVAKVITHNKFQISFCKVPRNKYDFAKRSSKRTSFK